MRLAHIAEENAQDAADADRIIAKTNPNEWKSLDDLRQALGK